MSIKEILIQKKMPPTSHDDLLVVNRAVRKPPTSCNNSLVLVRVSVEGEGGGFGWRGESLGPGSKMEGRVEATNESLVLVWAGKSGGGGWSVKGGARDELSVAQETFAVSLGPFLVHLCSC